VAGQGGLAEEVRAGLEEVVQQAPVKSSAPTDPLDELWFRKPVRQHVREFGVVLGIFLLILASASFYHWSLVTGTALFCAALAVVLLGSRAPRLLLPVWRSFIVIGELLGHIVTFAVLLLTWLVALIPLALGLKLFGVKVMNLGWREPVLSYWDEREDAKNDFRLLEKQF
jgi:hypothetical protein